MKRLDEDKTMFSMPGAQSTYRNLYLECDSLRVPETAVGVVKQLCAHEMELFFKLSFHGRSIKKEVLIEILEYDRHLRSIAPGLLSFLTKEQKETVIKLLRTFDFLSQGSDDLDIEQVCRIYESNRTND